MDLPIEGDSPKDGQNLTYLTQNAVIYSRES
jgi:hypothetical protein